MPERYFCHPESDCLFTTQGDQPATDGLVEEVTRAEYDKIRGQQSAAEEEAKRHCMCGLPIDHSPWEGHSPVSMFDYHRDGKDRL